MAHIKEDGKYPHRTDSAADPRSEAAPLLPGFPPQRRKRTADQADEQPHLSLIHILTDAVKAGLAASVIAMESAETINPAMSEDALRQRAAFSK